MTSPKNILPALVAVLALLVLAPAASAATNQISILQDDAVLLGESGHDADAAMAEAKAMGVDTVRTFIVWSRVAPNPRSRTAPAGFDGANPNSPGYNWATYDNFVDRARRHGLKVMLTLSPAIPYWASEQPSRCPHHVGGYRTLEKSCMWKPSPKQFGRFAAAIARRYGSRSGGPGAGVVDLYSMWNEPNLEHYLFPQVKRTKAGLVDLAAKRYRALWQAGYKAIRRYDPAKRNRVLFGETAAISSPVDTLYAALCLDERGRPFKGALRAAQGCKKPGPLPIGGLAVHPYNNHAGGTVFTRSFSGDSLAPAYINRLHGLLRIAERHRRIPRGKGIWLTEFGFQSTPPERKYGLSLTRHATALNEAERLFWADRRVKSIAQFELMDAFAKAREPEDADVYTTGLRFYDGSPKPALAAFRMPLVVTRLSRRSVEVWGQARPATGRTQVSLQVATPGGFVQVAAPRTSRAGYFKLRFTRRDAPRLRFRTEWRSPSGEIMRSREAFAGKRIRYLGKPLR